MFKNKYRIVRDSYCGFEVQVWRWWYPFWRQCYGSNTLPSLHEARRLAKRHMEGKPRRDPKPTDCGTVIEYIDITL